ncbi:dehydrodolichyl diphosphate synthase complex subunit DHDDS isoform X3 [Hydra vulgaris]|uniref:Alkyl transferase n=1 Tax=Hydra vulgaris TaxID=6087 RepID=A0ABM4BLC5_HYDVU
MSWLFGHHDRKPGIFLSLVYKILKAGIIPQHVAFIMDGNRRFACKEKIERREGHNKGFHKLTEVLQWCYELGIPEVTVYAFSIENFKRSQDEVDTLLEIFKKELNKLLEKKDELTEYSVCIRFIGNIALFDYDIREIIFKVINLTKNNNRSFLNIAMAYTSRDEITYAIREIAVGVDKGMILESDIDEELLENCFYTNKCKPVDLVIRTSGEVRLSDFLLWQTSFSTLCFVDSLWPEFTVWNLLFCIFKFQLGYNTIQNAKSTSKLKERRAQLELDFQSAYKAERCSEDNIDPDNIEKQTLLRTERINRFLAMVEDRRNELMFLTKS